MIREPRKSPHWPKIWRWDVWTKGYPVLANNDDELYRTLHPHRYRDESPAIPLPLSRHNNADDLSNELWLMILNLLPPKTLVQLMSVSIRLQDLCASILYGEIDASLHHYKIPDGNDSADFSWTHWDCDMVDKTRQRILNNFLDRPVYAGNVRHFTWTMGFHRPGMGKSEAQEHLFPQLQLFGLLQNVTRLDLDTGFARLPPTTDAHSLSLFPRASHIQLGGVMPYSLASAILHGQDKAPLTSLILFNVIEPGRLRNGSSYQHLAGPEEDAPMRIHPEDLNEIWPTGSTPTVVRPGCMRRLLNAELQARCRNLNHLLLRKQGQQYLAQELPSEITYDDDVYKEWADFIVVTQPRHLRLEHGGATTSPLNGRTSKSFGETSTLLTACMSPMDQRFKTHIAPVLESGWRRLRSLEIQGVCAEVTQPITASLASCMSHVEVYCDENVDWCWNGTVADPLWPAHAFIKPISSNIADEKRFMHTKYMELKPNTMPPREPRFWLHGSNEDMSRPYRGLRCGNGRFRRV